MNTFDKGWEWPKDLYTFLMEGIEVIIKTM
jgi:hypothetical protein